MAASASSSCCIFHSKHIKSNCCPSNLFSEPEPGATQTLNVIQSTAKLIHVWLVTHRQAIPAHSIRSCFTCGATEGTQEGWGGGWREGGRGETRGQEGSGAEQKRWGVWGGHQGSVRDPVRLRYSQAAGYAWSSCWSARRDKRQEKRLQRRERKGGRKPLSIHLYPPSLLLPPCSPAPHRGILLQTGTNDPVAPQLELNMQELGKSQRSFPLASCWIHFTVFTLRIWLFVGGELSWCCVCWIWTHVMFYKLLKVIKNECIKF